MIKRIFLLLAILIGNIGVSISFAQEVTYKYMVDYRNALSDAKVLYKEYNTTQRPLVSLASKEPVAGYIQNNRNQTIQWDVDTMVYVTTFKKKNSPYDKNAGSIINTQQYDLWVTIPSELNRKIIGFGDITGVELQERLTKALGMPIPTNADDLSSMIITLKVPKNKMLRPAMNPNPNPTNINVKVAYNYPYSEIFNYVEWYGKKCNATFLSTPTSEITRNHYPFTGLGYTYDWGDPVNHYGLSEFIVINNTDVVVVNKQTLDEYRNAIIH